VPKNSSNVARSIVSRLVTACRQEVVALQRAALSMSRAQRRAHLLKRALLQRASSRVVFRACARAMEKTPWSALGLDLTHDIPSAVERQYTEMEFYSGELKRLRSSAGRN